MRQRHPRRRGARRPPRRRPRPTSSRRHPVDEAAHARDLDADLVARREREVAAWDDARARHEEDTTGEAVVAKEVRDELRGPALELREGGLPREGDAPVARD